MSDAVTREETLLNAIATGETVDIVPVTRKEKYLRYLAGIGEKPSKPITREEMFLDKIQAGGTGGGGDEASVLDSLIDGSITEITSNAGSVNDYAFYKRSNLTTVNFPLATRISSYAFYNCRELITANFPLVTSIGTSGFNTCKKLTTADFPLVSKIESETFSHCSGLTSISFPLVTDISGSAFSYCTKLTSVSFPLAISLSYYSFQYCSNLMTVDFPVVTNVGNGSFGYCYSLKSVLLRNETVVTLSNTDAFTKCYHLHGTVNSTYNPDGLKDGYIYVPKALIEDYKAATNWSNFATQFRALEDYTVDGTITGELDETKI